MSATTINTKTTPTAEAIQEALAFLKNLSEKSSMESADKPESFFNSDIFKTIEAALKNSAEAKAVSENNEEASEDEDEEEEDNPFADDYYWNPGPEWKTIGLVAGGAALVGLGALLYKLFDD